MLHACHSFLQLQSQCCAEYLLWHFMHLRKFQLPLLLRVHPRTPLCSPHFGHAMYCNGIYCTWSSSGGVVVQSSPYKFAVRQVTNPFLHIVRTGTLRLPCSSACVALLLQWPICLKFAFANKFLSCMPKLGSILIAGCLVLDPNAASLLMGETDA